MLMETELWQQDVVVFTGNNIDISWTRYYNIKWKNTCRGPLAVKTDVRLWGYIREWGKALPKPRIDQYRVRLGICPLVKASHWRQLWEGRAYICLRCESGELLYRQNVTWEWLWWCSIFLEHWHNRFLFYLNKWFPWPGGSYCDCRAE